MSADWKWESWVPLSDDDKIDGPEEVDHCNRVHILRPGVANKFSTILQCIFSTTCMDRHFFQRLAGQNNKYERRDMRARSSTAYIGHKWSNLSGGEMI